MKRTALFLVVMLAVAGVCLAGDNPVVGTWKSVSVTSTATDGTTSEVQSEGRSMKIFTETHFAVVGQNEAGTFTHAHAGEIVLKGSFLTEKIQKSSNPDMVGKEATHEFSISGDDWVSTLTYPDGRKTKEVWKRVK